MFEWFQNLVDQIIGFFTDIFNWFTGLFSD